MAELFAFFLLFSLYWLCFLDPIEVKGGCDGVHMPKTPDGRSTGEAFVEFETEDDAVAALDKNNEHIGRRYIEG